MTGVTFVTRAGCSLCAAAQPLVEREAERAGRSVVVIDVDADAAFASFGDRVPVVLLDGVEVLAGRFDRRAIRKALA